MTIPHSPDAARSPQDQPFLRALTVAAVLLLASSATLAQSDNPPAAPESPPAAPGGTVSPALPSATDLLRDSREKLAAYRTLKASMTETVEFGPRRMKAEGVYLQGANNRVRVDVAISIGENKGRLLQVSEGDVLWTVYDAGPKPRITRRDVKQIIAAKKGTAEMTAQLAELGLGGIPALLTSIEQSMDFDPTQTAEIDRRSFYVLQGQWKPQLRERFQAQAQQVPSPTDEPRPLPAHVPDMVRLYLDAETLFPYRIRYLKRSTSAGTEPSPLLTLDFKDIVVNASLDPGEFRYAPPADAEVADITRFYLDQAQPPPGQPATGQPTTPPQQP